MFKRVCSFSPHGIPVLSAFSGLLPVLSLHLGRVSFVCFLINGTAAFLWGARFGTLKKTPQQTSSKTQDPTSVDLILEALNSEFLM